MQLLKSPLCLSPLRRRHPSRSKRAVCLNGRSRSCRNRWLTLDHYIWFLFKVNSACTHSVCHLYRESTVCFQAGEGQLSGRYISSLACQNPHLRCFISESNVVWYLLELFNEADSFSEICSLGTVRGEQPLTEGHDRPTDSDGPITCPSLILELKKRLRPECTMWKSSISKKVRLSTAYMLLAPDILRHLQQIAVHSELKASVAFTVQNRSGGDNSEGTPAAFPQAVTPGVPLQRSALSNRSEVAGWLGGPDTRADTSCRWRCARSYFSTSLLPCTSSTGSRSLRFSVSEFVCLSLHKCVNWRLRPCDHLCARVYLVWNYLPISIKFGFCSPVLKVVWINFDLYQSSVTIHLYEARF
jgi:hypothetical protein